MAILAGSGANADVAEESVMHPIIEAEIMKTRTRPGAPPGGPGSSGAGRRTGPPGAAAAAPAAAAAAA